MKPSNERRASPAGIKRRRMISTEAPVKRRDRSGGVSAEEEAASTPDAQNTEVPNAVLPSSSTEGMPSMENVTTPQAPLAPSFSSDSARKPISLLRRDPIYRVMHTQPRSDMLEVVKCKFAREHCERALQYFDASYMQNALRRLRLQIGCDGPTGLYLFFPRISYHRFTLRVLDLSRNSLTSADVTTLCDVLQLGPQSHVKGSPEWARPSSTVSTTATSSSLELLDLSYNVSIGNAGALHLMQRLRQNTMIRAVQLKHCGVDDEGASGLAVELRHRPQPAEGEGQLIASSGQRSKATFFLNLNENCIGAVGTSVLGKGLPAFVSVTLCKQRIHAVR